MTRLRGTALALALFAAAMRFAWLGWGHRDDGVEQGPYRVGQVAGCALSIATGTVLAHVRVRKEGAILPLALAADLGVAVPWAFDASSDSSGLWVVGLGMLLIGAGGGLALLLTATNAFLDPTASPTKALTTCSVATLLTLTLAPWPVAAIVPLAATALVFFARCLTAPHPPRLP